MASLPDAALQAYQDALPYLDLIWQYTPVFIQKYFHFWFTIVFFSLSTGISIFLWPFSLFGTLPRYIAGSLFLWLCAVGGFDLTVRIYRKYTEYFGPLRATVRILRLLINLFGRKMWRTYKLLLLMPTTVCYKYRKHFYVGEILMFPLFVAWTCLPLLIPYFVGKKYLYLLSTPATGLLFFVAVDLIAISWKDKESFLVRKPVLEIVSVQPRFQKYGMTLSIHCKKPADFVIKQSRLHLLGSELWKALSKSIGPTTITTFRYTMHPIILCDKFFPANVFQSGSESVTIPVEFGTASQGWLQINSKYVFQPRLQDLVSKHNNPTMELVMEYGTKQTFGWNPSGVLLTMKFSVADLLRAAQSETDLTLKQD